VSPRRDDLVIVISLLSSLQVGLLRVRKLDADLRRGLPARRLHLRGGLRDETRLGQVRLIASDHHIFLWCHPLLSHNVIIVSF
jgi:hypothetical protein